MSTASSTYTKMTTNEKVEFNDRIINDQTATTDEQALARSRNQRIQESSAGWMGAAASLMSDYPEGSKEREFLNMMFDTQQATLKYA